MVMYSDAQCNLLLLCYWLPNGPLTRRYPAQASSSASAVTYLVIQRIACERVTHTHCLPPLFHLGILTLSQSAILRHKPDRTSRPAQSVLVSTELPDWDTCDASSRHLRAAKCWLSVRCETGSKSVALLSNKGPDSAWSYRTTWGPVESQRMN